MTQSPTKESILVVDDDQEMVSMLADVLGEAGYGVLPACSGHEALGMLESEPVDLMISDLRMSGMNGHQLLGEIRRRFPHLPVIIITAFGSIQNAVESIKLGAFDYLTKPFSNDELLLALERALENRELRREVVRLRDELAQSYGLENLLAKSPAMLEQIDILRHVADSSASVLITGESGVGKDLFAHALHYQSGRRKGPFVAISCAAIPDTLLESELFGFVRGAFTDARQSKLGLFQAANRGTLFLDEIGELPMQLQAKLLRVIEEKKVRPLGSTSETSVDVRIVSATNLKLEEAIATGKFRPDLFYRIATVNLAIPPLRERAEDIQILIKHFLSRAGAEAGNPAITISPEATESLMRYAWPGNVRELQNAIHHAVLLCREERIERKDLPQRVAGEQRNWGLFDNAVAQRLTLEELERGYVRAVLEALQGNKSEAANILRIDRKTLYRKIEE